MRTYSYIDAELCFRRHTVTISESGRWIATLHLDSYPDLFPYAWYPAFRRIMGYAWGSC